MALASSPAQAEWTSVREESVVEVLDMKKPSVQIGLGIALGAGIGAAVAVTLGTGGLWLAVGIAVGSAIGASMSRRNSKKEILRAND
jgi:hypothetical protein